MILFFKYNLMKRIASISVFVIYFLYSQNVFAQKTKLFIEKEYVNLDKIIIDSTIFNAIGYSIDSLVKKFELDIVDRKNSSDIIISIKFLLDQPYKLSVKFTRTKDNNTLEGFLFTLPSVRNNLKFKQKDLIKPFFICLSLITSNRSFQVTPIHLQCPAYSLQLFDIVPKNNIQSIDVVYNSIKESLRFQQDLIDFNFNLFSENKEDIYFDYRLRILISEDITKQKMQIQLIFLKKDEVVLEKLTYFEETETLSINDFMFSSKINRVIKQSLIELFQIHKTY